MAEKIVYERDDGTWGWQLKADNGKIIATDHNQGYENEAEARKMRDAVVGGTYKEAKGLRRPKKKKDKK